MKLNQLNSIFLILFALGATAMAPSASSIEKKKKVTPTNQLTRKLQLKQATPPPYSVSGSVEMMRSSSLYDLKNGSKYEGMDYMLGLGYSMPVGVLSTRFSVTQVVSPTDEDSTILNDGNVAYMHSGFKLMNEPRSVSIKFTPSVTAVVPMSDQSKRVDQLQTAIIVAGSFGFRAGEETSLHGLSLGTSISFGQNFHKFESTNDGKILNKNSSSQAVSLAYAIKNLTMSLSYANKIRWPYAGEATTSFELTEGISYSFLKAWNVSLGHTNSGATLKPNGYDSNISLANDDTSIVFFGVGYGFGGPS